MRRIAGLLVVALVTLAACGGGAGDDDAAQDDAVAVTRTTLEATTTTTTTQNVDPDQLVAALDPYSATVGEYLDLAVSFSALSDPPGIDAGMPASDVGGAFGGEVAPGASVYVLGQTVSDQARGAVVVVDVSGGTVPSQLIAFALTNLDLAATTPTTDVSDPSAIFASDVIPALAEVSDTVQRFNLGSTSLELTVRDSSTYVFAFVKRGEEVPGFVLDLP